MIRLYDYQTIESMGGNDRKGGQNDRKGISMKY